MVDDVAAWTIKSVPIETRQKAVKAANAQGVTVGKWVIGAVDRVADWEASNQVIPPGKPEPLPFPSPLAGFDLAGFAAALSSTVEAIKAAGETPAKNLGANAAATLNRYMRAVRGTTKGQTIGPNGQTTRLIIGAQEELQ